jgi:signal transduction histidine kinase
MSHLSVATRPSRLRLWPKALEALFVADARQALIWCSCALFALVVVDLVTPPVSLLFAYISIVVLATWHGGPFHGLVFAALAFGMQLLGGFLNPETLPQDSVVPVDIFNRLFTFLVVVGLVAALRTLYDRLQRNTERLRAMSHHLVRMQEIERQKLARELHDSAGQQLAGVGISLDIVKSELPPAVPEAVVTRLAYCKACVDDMVDWTRGTLDELRPTMLDSLGLVPAMQKLARDLPRLAGLEVSVTAQGDRYAMGHEEELAVFRIVQECLLNVSRHSGAPRASVFMDYRSGSLVVTVEDRGRGFEPGEDRRSTPRSFGLLIMHERATAIGARLDIDSSPGAGTRVTLEVWPAERQPAKLAA